MMLGPPGNGPLARALMELTGLCGDGDRAALEELRGRLAERRLRVLVAGEAKRGKSTLVNALLGRVVLPVGVTPLTALATTVRHGQEEGVTAVFAGSRAQSFPLSALDDLVTERGNPRNRRGLESVTVAVDCPLLARGVELVDSPGTGSIYAHNTAAAQAALETMDAAVFVVSADPPVSASERELMAQVAELSVTMFVVLNKADYLGGYSAAGGELVSFDAAALAGPGVAPPSGGGELLEALEFTARVAGEVTGRPVKVYPMSARAALTGQADPGMAAFTQDFTSYLEQDRAADVRLSVAGHTRRLAQRLADEVALARRASQMRSGEAAERVGEFSARLAAVSGWRQDAADLVNAESARMLAAVNESAERTAKEGTARVWSQLRDLLDGELRSAPAATIERDGRTRVAELALGTAETWRQRHAQQLEQGLARLDERVTRDLRAELDAVREAAADLLGLELKVPGPGERLEPDLRFFYLTAEQAGQTELLAGAVRRWLPGEAGRNRARAYLRRQAHDLVPQQIGRARADLQFRLAEATRHLVRTADTRYTDSTRRLESALGTAAAARAATASEAAQLDRGFAARQGAIARVLSKLAEAAGTGNGGQDQARPVSAS
jgi:GTP-binding protein EngB required for normal cell division